MIINQVRLDKEGLESFMGPLEARVLSVLWGLPYTEAPARIVSKAIPDLAYTTIITTLNRMAHKGLINRRLHGRNLSYYSPLCKEDEFIDRCLLAAFEQIRKEYPSTFSELINQYHSTIKLS